MAYAFHVKNHGDYTAYALRFFTVATLPNKPIFDVKLSVLVGHLLCALVGTPLKTLVLTAC